MFNLNSSTRSVGINLNILYPNHGNQRVDVQVVTDSCTGNAIFTQVVDLGAGGVSTASLTFNNVQNVVVPPNWFFRILDPQQNHAMVGCGSVVSQGVNANAILGTVNAVPSPVALAPAQGSANLLLNSGTGTVTMSYNILYVLRPSQAMNLQVRTGSCAGNIVFDQRIDLGANGSSINTAIINGVSGNTLPMNWFVTVVDPQQITNGQPTAVGCGMVQTNGVFGNVVIGQVTP
jgi:hypothetical protein